MKDMMKLGKKMPLMENCIHHEEPETVEKLNAKFEQEKKDKEIRERREKEMEKKTRTKEINSMFELLVTDQLKQDMQFGLFSTAMFILFYGGHVYLSYLQYQCYNMVSFNMSLTQSLLPGIDPATVISSKQFLTVEEMEEYFLIHVNERMSGASDAIDDKPIFHRFNHMVPFIKMTTIQGKEVECGSTRAN